MGWLIRTLFIWLLVLAVPVQGAAAAAMVPCGPSHHGGHAAVQTQPAVPQAHPHHSGTGATGATAHEHAQAMAVAAEAPSVSAMPVVSDGFSPSAEHTCSACAACCSVGAILGSVLALPAPAVAPTVFATLVASVDPFAADGPDRPPRPVLA
jgi:hypothetical protein